MGCCIVRGEDILFRRLEGDYIKTLYLREALEVQIQTFNLVIWFNGPRNIKKQTYYFANKGPSSKAMVFPVVMYGCQSWTTKKAENRRIDAFELWCWEKTLESPLDCKEIQAVHSKRNQSWIFIGRTVAEAETPILCPPDAKSWLIWKDPDAGKDWSGEEKGTLEDEMAGWHHWLNRHGFEQTPGVGDGQGGLACCSPWGLKESDTTEQLNWTDFI